MTWDRPSLLVGVMLALLGAAVTWNASGMIRQRGAARRAAADRAVCQELASQIALLREKPALASAQDMEVRELGARIEAAARQAGLEPSSLEGVFPQAMRRVGDGPYLQKPTALTLRNVTLTQAAAMLYHLSERSGLVVRDLRLRAPHGETAADLWDVEATLTYLLYAPATGNARDE